MLQAKLTTAAFLNSTKVLSIRRILDILKQDTNASIHSQKLFTKISLLEVVAHKTLNQTNQSIPSAANHDTHLLIPNNTVRKSKISQNTHIRRWILSLPTTDQVVSNKTKLSIITMLCPVNSYGRIQLTKSYIQKNFLHQCDHS